MTIKFFQPPTAPGTANLSPFCAKLDMMLQISELAFERHVEGDTRQGPKQKLPFIDDNGMPIGDTYFIERHLQKAHRFDSLHHLSPEARAQGNMIMATMEEKLYWVLVYGRWQKPENAKVMTNIFFGNIPDETLRENMATGAQAAMRQTLNGQGMGRHTEEEVLEIGRQIVDDLSIILAEDEYYFGSKPTVIDASVFGMLVNFVQSPIATLITKHIGSKPNLVRYMDRIAQQFFPQSPKVTA